jgi:hypothetical protein
MDKCWGIPPFSHYISASSHLLISTDTDTSSEWQTVDTLPLIFETFYSETPDILFVSRGLLLKLSQLV